MTSSRMICNLNAVTETGMQRVVIYWKAVRLRSSRVMASSLYLCSGMSCQWSSACISCMSWLNFQLPLTTWAATFNTHCNLLVTDWRLRRRRCCTSPCKMLQRHAPVTQQTLLNVYRDVSKAMNMVEAGRVGVGSMFLKTKVNQDDNSKSWYSTSWGNHTSELRVVTCHMDDTVLPATDTSECVPSNPSHEGWYLTYLSWRDGRLSCSSWLDSETAGRRTSDLLITSLMLNHCTTKAANSKHSNMLTWWIMSTAGCKDGKEPSSARQSVVYCRHCVLDRFWWLYYVAVLASSSLLQTLTLMSSYSAHLGCFCDHHWRHSCCDWSSCFQRRFLY